MTELVIAEAGPVMMPLAEIKMDPELQCRASGVSKATVREYAEAMRAGARFPAVIVFRDKQGVAWMADGFHRASAAAAIDATEIEVEIREGSRRDAQLYAAGCNSSHGLKRSNSDRRRAALMLLSDPTWGKRSDNWIAKAANVSQPFISKLRATSNVISEGPREAADGRTLDTSKIGKVAADDDTTVAKLTRHLQSTVSQWPQASRHALSELLLKLAAEAAQ